MTERHADIAWDGLGESLEEMTALQLSLYQRLDELSRELDALSEGEPGEELAAVLSLRQDVVDSLVALDRRLPPGRQAWDQAAAATSPDVRERLEGMLRDCRDLAQAVAERDERGHRRLAEKREALARELSGLLRARAASGAYAPGAAEGARYQDQEA